MTSAQERQKHPVLVIDDEEPVLHLVRSLLSSHGRLCRTTSEPREALEILDTGFTDLVISDGHLASGASREILDRAQALGIPVVFTVRQQATAAATRALVAGAYEVVRKPFELSRLPGIVARALERQSLVRENKALRDQLSLYQIITVVHASIEEQEVIQGALTAVEQAFQADRARLFCRRPGQKRLSHWRAGPLYADPLAAVEERIVQQIVDRDAPLVVPDEDGAGTELLAGQAYSAVAMPLRGREEVIAALVVLRKRNHWAFTPHDLSTLELLAANIAAVLKGVGRTREAVESRTGLSDSDPSMIGNLVTALDAREHEVRGHSVRVAEYALRLAKEMGIVGAELIDLKFGALLHDIGKIGVSDEILLKQGPLTEDERCEMERHPQIGHQIVESIRFVCNAAEIVLCHQERYDGSGYPIGMAGKQIPRGARIVAVADTLEAMTHQRPYRQALGYSEVVQELTERSMRKFDPEVVSAFLRVPETDWDLIRNRQAHDSPQPVPHIPNERLPVRVRESMLLPPAAGRG